MMRVCQRQGCSSPGCRPYFCSNSAARLLEVVHGAREVGLRVVLDLAHHVVRRRTSRGCFARILLASSRARISRRDISRVERLELLGLASKPGGASQQLRRCPARDALRQRGAEQREPARAQQRGSPRAASEHGEACAASCSTREAQAREALDLRHERIAHDRARRRRRRARARRGAGTRAARAPPRPRGSRSRARATSARACSAGMQQHQRARGDAVDQARRRCAARPPGRPAPRARHGWIDDAARAARCARASSSLRVTPGSSAARARRGTG